MKEGNFTITDYKLMRDEWREKGNKFLEAYYQIIIVQEAEKRKFSLHKRSDLRQQWYILSDLLSEILGIDDADYQRGIYNEVILSGCGTRLSGNEQECRICNSCFEESSKLEYVYGAFQLHLSSILGIAHENVQAAQMYADNLLLLLKLRYGVNSWQYAKMKLHIIGEYYYHYKRETFLYEFEKNYGYFEEYTADYDCFLCQTLLLYVYLLEENADKNYSLWLTRGEEAVEQKKGDKFYYPLKCMIEWIKAMALKKQNRAEAALGILQEAITKYLKRDCDDEFPVYGSIYLLAANVCYKLQDFDKMLDYAQKGLITCDKLKQKGSELHYNLYNYIGISYMNEHRWKEAEKLYASSVKDIECKYGKENENYIIYMGNLVVLAIYQGKSADSYIKELRSIKNTDLRKKFRSLLNNELNVSIARGDSINLIKMIYEQCIRSMEGEDDKQEKERLDTVYLSALANAEEFNDKANLLLETLEKNYKDNFTGETARIYWNSRLLWEWNKGNLQAALEISERLFQKMREEEYEQYRNIVINYIQLLIINKQYDTSKQLILSMIELFNNKILDIGYSNVFQYLSIVRCLISMYIQIFKKESNDSQLYEKEAKLLLKKIMCCKTIERELKGVLGKDEESGQMGLYYFRQNHRKLAALEIGLKIGKLSPSEYESKRKKCLLEMAEHETNLNQRIIYQKMIRAYSFETIKVPHNTACIEYFAYYNFRIDVPMLRLVSDKNENLYSYLEFVLSENRGQVNILDIINIPLNGAGEKWNEKLLDLLEHTEIYDEKEIEEAIKYFKQLFAMQVLKYLEGKKKIYLGLDFLQQMIPMDLIFCNSNGEPMDIILVDSICYIGDDTRICIEKSNALVVGNPKLNLNGVQKTPSLPCGEIECIKIAEMFGTKAYIREEAKQRVLWGKEHNDVIHISTHGEWRDVGDNVLLLDDLFIDSFLKFAGFEDWEEGRQVKAYGNGIVSGDDFLFMDLSNTKLVVLSTCVSGLGCTKGLSSIHGMRWAIGAAGAENSITTLWKVSDDASAILMIFFYRNLRNMPIGEALYEAKRQLRTITVAGLRSDNDLKQIVEIAQKDKADQYASNDNIPYAHWKYWAGFVCYHR